MKFGHLEGVLYNPRNRARFLSNPKMHDPGIHTGSNKRGPREAHNVGSFRAPNIAVGRRDMNQPCWNMSCLIKRYKEIVFWDSLFIGGMVIPKIVTGPDHLSRMPSDNMIKCTCLTEWKHRSSGVPLLWIIPICSENENKKGDDKEKTFETT